MKTAVCLIVVCALISSASSSEARSIIKKPLPNPSFKINSAHNQNEETCSFTVRIVTSCSSVPYTRDRVSISFGDAYGAQVYAPRLDDPSTRTFEPCSADTFDMYGPCSDQICYMYLQRSGDDGWLPERVEVYGDTTRPVSFDYGDWIPSDMWYGHDYCSEYAGSAAARSS